MMLIKVCSLTVALAFAIINLCRGCRGQSIPFINIFLNAGSLVVFAWSMGWLQ